MVPLSLVVACAWLTNLFSAVMMNYWQGSVALLLGAALTAFYILQMAYEHNWIEIAKVLAPGVRPQDNFFFKAR